ncbi:MAG TPA: pyruvate kinase [Candidatus Saccharimonadales bacterium]|nr:pyruvate kinase [Candidatus Saccharimonadales bacterium]
MTATDKAPNVSSRVFKRTKILATVGPATDSYEQMFSMLKTGVNGFRMNFSHGDHEEHGRRIKWAREASTAVGKPVAVLQDLQGPKIRLGDFDGRIEVQAGDVLQFGYKVTYQKGGIIPVQYDLSQKMKIGERLYLFDGKLRGIVSDIQPGIVTAKIDNNGFLLKRKGINLPDTDFGGDILTPKDLRDIEYGVTQDIDYVALSFVQTAEDITNLRRILESHGSDAKVIAKIETQAAIEPANLEEIVRVSDGVMVARGDLAVEVSPEVVPVVQRQIIGYCQQYGKLSIVATQMLASMVDNPEPTRAEVSDVANAVITGADCVMLSDETANGQYPIETIATMKRIILFTQNNAAFNPIFAHQSQDTLQGAISSSVLTLANQIKAAAIVVQTKSGDTALSMASYRPNMPLVVVTSTPRVASQLALMHASKTFLREDVENVGANLAQWLKDQGVFTRGDRVVIISGRQPGLVGGTDTIKVRVLE